MSGLIVNPQLFWSALEAIATSIAALAAIIAAFFIIPEWRRSRMEEVSHKVEGYRLATDLLSSEDFLNAARELQADRGPALTYKWFEKYPPLLHEILRTMEILEFLIQEEYLDESLLFRLYGFRLSKLSKLVSAVEQIRKSPQVIYWSDLYSSGNSLLERSLVWRSKQKKWQFLRDPGNPADIW